LGSWESEPSKPITGNGPEIRIRAESRTGELLNEADRDGQRERQGGDRKSKSRNGILKIKDLGLSPNQSSRYQKMALFSGQHMSGVPLDISVGN
jgi:hypothetical protein